MTPKGTGAANARTASSARSLLLALLVAAAATGLLAGPAPEARAGDVRIGPAAAPTNLLGDVRAALDGVPTGLAAAPGTALSAVSAPTHGGTGALAMTNAASG